VLTFDEILEQNGIFPADPDLVKLKESGLRAGQLEDICNRHEVVTPEMIADELASMNVLLAEKFGALLVEGVNCE